MKEIIFILTICLFIIVPTTSFAADRYQRMASDDLREFFFDSETIEFAKNYTGKPDLSTLRVWIKTVYTEKGVSELLASREEKELDNSGLYKIKY